MIVRYPVILCRSGLFALVIGGGPVGQRKAIGLLEAGVRVRLICREPIPPDWMHRDSCIWEIADYHIDQLTGVDLVFAAATPMLNAQIVVDARTRGVLVNSADDPEQGDFIVPATIRQGDLLLSISTGGAAPSLARRIRERLEVDFDASFGIWLTLLAEIRPQILSRIPDAVNRRDLFEQLTNWDWLTRIREEGPDLVRQAWEDSIQRLEHRPSNSL